MDDDDYFPVPSKMIARLECLPQGEIGKLRVEIGRLRAENAMLLAAINAIPCPICHGVEGCDHTISERARTLTEKE